MSKQDLSTFEEINEHVENANLESYANLESLTAVDARSRLCDIYQIVRPILVAVSGIGILPKKWRTAITMLISILDTICG